MNGDISILKDGKRLNGTLYSIDFNTRVFSSKEDDLVLDFKDWYGWTFRTGNNCTFQTTGSCTFKTGNNCTFKTGNECTFDTGYNCTFKTGNNCTFKTGGSCTFKTGELCVFLLWDINTCKFKSYDGNSTILDREGGQHYLLTKEFVQLRKLAYE